MFIKSGKKVMRTNEKYTLYAQNGAMNVTAMTKNKGGRLRASIYQLHAFT